jgi:hypothetical protein
MKTWQSPMETDATQCNAPKRSITETAET